MRGRGSGRRPPPPHPLSAATVDGGRPRGFWRRLLGPFFLPAVAVVVAVGVLGGGLVIRYAFITSPDQAAVNRAPRISDTRFEQAANAVCKRYVGVFNTATTLGNEPTAKQVSDNLSFIADAFDRMVVELRAVPVAAPDRATVAAWFAQWDAYDAFGHRYAAAVGTGSERDLVRNDSASQGALRRNRNAFATANHMPSCNFP